MDMQSEKIDRRRYTRYEVDWRASIMNKSGAAIEIYHDRLHDISLAGAGIYSDTDIFTEGQLVILVETPLPYGRVRKVITGIECNMCKPVFLADRGKFHIGLDFVRFYGVDKHFLAEALFTLGNGRKSRNEEPDAALQ
jgi:c-di-GMP-binding flagellar brake protein YcgR